MQISDITSSVIYAHPYDKSFNYAIYQTVLQTFVTLDIETFAHDLYKEQFNPVLTTAELGKKPTTDKLVQQYTRELMQSDILVFIHPNWWGQPPAILKGYIDRVIRPPHAYDFPEQDSGGGLPVGKLAGKTGIVFNTSNTEKDRENTYFHDPLEFIWNKCVFGFCGIDRYDRKMFRIIADSTHDERLNWLAEVREIITDNCMNYWIDAAILEKLRP
ncbi:MAG: NAD(P)H-dependent oxidoreductase [candidate division KSB1 bacterium]|nr:NAD(P)H-dependent oxidoreductase [candidate division KSB1 bacterium]